MPCFLCENESTRACQNCSKPICDAHSKQCTLFVLKWGQSVPKEMTVCSECADKHRNDYRWYISAVIGFALTMAYILARGH